MMLGYLLYDFSHTSQVCDFVTPQCDRVLGMTPVGNFPLQVYSVYPSHTWVILRLSLV
jgi:hypothetical protein